MGYLRIVRWFTAHRSAKFDEQAGWGVEPGVYLGVDARGVILQRERVRPRDAVIIHDLGHALLAPVGLLEFEKAPLALDTPAALRAFLLSERANGRVALGETSLRETLVEQRDDSTLPSILWLDDESALTRRLVPAGPSGAPSLVGALQADDPFDVAVWDLDAPQLRGLPEQVASELIWSGRAGPCVRELWIAGQRWCS